MSTKSGVFRDLVWLSFRHILFCPTVPRIRHSAGKHKCELFELANSIIYFERSFWPTPDWQHRQSIPYFILIISWIISDPRLTRAMPQCQRFKTRNLFDSLWKRKRAMAITCICSFSWKCSSSEELLVEVVLFVMFLCVVDLLEGMQITFFAAAKIPKSEHITGNISPIKHSSTYHHIWRKLASRLLFWR